MDDNKDIFSSLFPEDPEELKSNSDEMLNESKSDNVSDSFNGFEDVSSGEGVTDIYSNDISSNSNKELDLNSFSSGAVADAKKQRTKKKFMKQRFLKAFLSIVLVGIITVSMILGTFLLYAFTMVDGTMDYDLNNLELHFTTAIYVMDDETGEWVEYQRLHGEYNRIWKPYNAAEAKMKDNENYDGIPQMLADAFIAIEDKRFHTHYGVDWKRTFGAVINTVIPIYSSRQGGSTITQQLVKNLTGDNDTSAMRKVREIMRARYLENHYSKDTIIECYLNTIPMGHGFYGVEVAANYYFGKSVNDLTLLECASLASITKAPSYYAPDDNPEKNKERRETVLALMLEEGYITQEEHDAALKEEFKLVASREHLNETTVNNYFVDTLITQVTNDLAEKYDWDPAHAAENFYSGGYKIYATLDPDVQEAVDEVYSNAELYGLEGKNGEQLQGAITIMDYKGRVKGLAGGIGEKDGNRVLNRATDSVRQPGSSMKPLSAYALAIENNMLTYSTLVNDVEKYYNVGSGEPWKPTNWYTTGYKGLITVEKALRISCNTIPVDIVNTIGTKTSYDFLTQKLRIDTLTEQDMNLSPLGMGGTNGGLTTMNSAAAYAVFGNGGQYYEPTLYYAVYDQHNDVVLSNENMEPHPAISQDTATIMNKLLQRVVYSSDGTGKQAASAVKDMYIYAKTGTTNIGKDSVDLWFSGGTPYYVGSAWCGYDTPQNITDTKMALKMWSAVMSKIHEGLEPKGFPQSSYTVERYYCTETGHLATDACESKGVGCYKTTTIGKMPVCDKHKGTVLDTPEAEKQKAEEAAKAESEAAGEGSASE